MATYGLRSSRSNGRGAIHAPHPDFTGKDQRPLCPATTKWGHGLWWSYTSDQVTCRACLKLLGKTPAPKRMSAKSAVGKVLRDLGLRPKWDFSAHDHLFPMDQSGGFRSVEYTTVTIYGDEPKQKVIDNAKAIVEALWTNKFGRHPFSVWVREMPSGGIWVEIDTDNMYDIYRAKKPECRRVANYWDLPDRELYWGEEPADETPEKEPETMTACPTHPSVCDERGEFADRLPAQPCESGADYGVWTEDDGGFLCTFDCALSAANYAAELLAEDADQELKILRECHDHPGQREDGCEECFSEYDDTADDQDNDADEEF